MAKPSLLHRTRFMPRKPMTGAAAAVGMAANLCVESHLRELLELGFEVAVVRDATAGPTTPEGDGYRAALINYRYIANALWSTAQTVEFLKAKQVKREQAVPRDAGHSLANTRRSSILCKPEKRQDHQDNHNCPDDVDDVVHEFHLST
jgi:hypothetical protein